MKAIAVFSGKGGVGKSTVSALFALALAKTRDVVLLDLDVNTPSQPVMFGGREEIEWPIKRRGSLRIVSTGFSTKKAIMHTGSMARGLMRSLAKKAVEMNPDVCIIDMPPGTGDAQLEVCSTLKPSSFLLVVQPNRLSYEDATRAVEVFKGIGVTIAGVVQNMIGDLGELSDTVLDMPVLAHVVLKKDIAELGSAGRIDDLEENPLNAIVEKIYEEAISVDWREKKRVLLEGSEYYEITWEQGERPHFVGLASWDEVRKDLNAHYESLVKPDLFLDECTAEKIERMLEHLDETGTGMFMITKAPQTTVTLFPGEIGMAHIGEESSMHYGVPRIAYQTDEGEVVLFANEASPVSHEKMLMVIAAGEHVRIGATSRYVPKYWVMEQIEYAFGRLARMPMNWREKYEELGLTPAKAKGTPKEVAK